MSGTESKGYPFWELGGLGGIVIVGKIRNDRVQPA